MLTAQSHGHSRRSMSSSHSISISSEPVSRVFKVLESEDEYNKAKAVGASETGNACCFVYVSPSVCSATGETVKFAQEVSEKGEADNVDFYVCDVKNPVGIAAAKQDNVVALPSFAFYYDGQKLEDFTGDSRDKFKASCKATIGKRYQIVKKKEEEKAAAERAEAEAAAAAAGENQESKSSSKKRR